MTDQARVESFQEMLTSFAPWKLRRKFVLWVGLFLLVASGAQAASYVQTDGTVVAPILTTGGAVHSYSGNNLEPFANATGAYLYGANLESANLESALLGYAYLYGANLESANLESASLLSVDLRYANLSSANLPNAEVESAYLQYANLSNANLVMTDLNGAHLSGADLNGADLNGAYLRYADLRYANLSGANLTGAYLQNAYWLGASTGSAYYNAETNFTGAWSGDLENSPLFDPVAAGWTLVPEPNTALLLGIGLAGLGMRRRATS